MSKEHEQPVLSGFEETFGTPPETDESQEAEETVENQPSAEDESIETSAESAEVEESTETEDQETEESGDDLEAKVKELEEKLAENDKRMRDKDKYINELQNPKKEKAQEEPKEEETDFWDDPEKYVKSTQEQIANLQFQIQEQQYARTKDDYYDIVTPESFQVAVAADPDFAKEFESSDNKFETAYTYLKQQNDDSESYEASLREKIKAELMDELGVKPKKTPPKSVGDVSGSSKESANSAPSDGFASMYGDTI